MVLKMAVNRVLKSFNRSLKLLMIHIMTLWLEVSCSRDLESDKRRSFVTSSFSQSECIEFKSASIMR